MAAGFKRATVNGARVPATQANFPVYVDLARLGILNLAEAQSIRVYTDVARTDELAREIVSVTEMHVRVTSLTNLTSIFVDWDEIRADYAVGATFGRNNVWTGYAAIYHLGNVLESSAGRDGTDVNTVAFAAGKLGNGAGFVSGNSEQITTPTTLTDLPGNSAFTLSFWIKKTGSLLEFIATRCNASGHAQYNIVADTAGRVSFEVNPINSSTDRLSVNNSTGSLINTGSWTKVTITKDATRATAGVKMFINGSTQTVVDTNPNTLSTNAPTGTAGAIGSRTIALGNYITAEIDSFRIRTTEITATWETTEYNNQNDELDFWGAWSDLGLEPFVLRKNIGALAGETWAVCMSVTGTLGTVTVNLGTTGATAVFTATGGVQTLQGVYGGVNGLILTRSATFNGTIDNVQWVKVVGAGAIDWSLTQRIEVFAISSSVVFKRIEDEVFNRQRLYRYLDLMFKNLDGQVTVTISSERSDIKTAKVKTFSVGNTGGAQSSFSKRRISFLFKSQAIVIGLSNASLNQTFSIAQFLLDGSQENKKMFEPSKIISV